MRAYLARHPERAEDAGQPVRRVAAPRPRRREVADPAPRLEEMAEVLGSDPQTVAGELAALRSDLHERLRHGTLGEMFARAAEVEPLIGEAWPETTRMRVPPFFSELTVRQVSVVHAAQRAAGFARARVLLVIADPRWGGGRRAEGHIAHALADSAAAGVAPEDVVVVYTDAGGSAPPGRFPDGVREVDLAALLGDLPDEAAERVLVELVRSFRAEAVVNVNSGLLYRAMATYGKALAASERMFLVLFCNEQLAFGSWVGRPLRYVYRCFDLVEGVIIDSDHLRDWLRERHQLGPGLDDRLHVFRAPVDPAVPVAPAVDAATRPPAAGLLGRPLRPPEAGRPGLRGRPADARRLVPDVGRAGAPRGRRGCAAGQRRPGGAATRTSPSSTWARRTPGSTPPAGTACRASCWRSR